MLNYFCSRLYYPSNRFESILGAGKNKDVFFMEKSFSFMTNGAVCSRNIQFKIKDGRVFDVVFAGGCNGNLKGIGSLVEGMGVEQVIERLRGVRCGGKNTSCPDQFAEALGQAMEQFK